MKEVIFCVILGCAYINADELLAAQSFGPGYPQEHFIKKNNDGDKIFDFINLNNNLFRTSRINLMWILRMQN
jgi:hypothetical protein